MKQREFRRILRQAVYVPILLLLLLAVFFIAQLRRFSNAVNDLHRADLITNSIIDLQKLILDQETGMRGYELTGDPAMLAPYTAGMQPIQQNFADLGSLLSGNSAQEQRLTTLSQRYQLWLSRARRIVANDKTLINNPEADEENKILMDNIRSDAHQMLVTQEKQREEQFLRETPYVTKADLLTTLLAAFIIGLIVAIFTRQRLRTVSRSYDATLAEVEQHTREAHESRQRFKTTLESIGDGVIACDMRGRVQFMNAIAASLTGWAAEDATGRPLTEVFHIIHEETREPAENPVKVVQRLKKVVGLANHTALVSRDGREYVIDDSAAPILGPDGKMTGIVLVFHDVTEQRRTEAALIAGEKLAVAGRLAASIAHEIHNPLDSVSNLLFLLKEEKDPARRDEYLTMAEQELARTMQISRTMLSLYRESKAPVTVDLKDLIEGVMLLLERRIAMQQIDMAYEFVEPCTVEGFPAEIRQVVTNVLVNAIEAAGMKGRIRIRLRSAPAEEFRGAGAMIEVADSGPGIQNGDAHRLFRPFFTTKGEKGTGLGLWVSMGIVQKHGGSIRLSNCGEAQYTGACASIYLPSKTLAGLDHPASPVA
ncbi:MAG TPA: CHASE3 domain-containing protein [Acidobacteriaceae bacterium]|nr:CHASE3 domain-containing protein [Acidobacteriaceae bacterium]